METQKLTDTEHAKLEFGDDLIYGAAALAKFLFGANGSRRKIYYLAKYTKIPLFRIGSVLCGRRSVLTEWVAKQENRAK